MLTVKPKRNFEEMSHSAALSPSPMSFSGLFPTPRLPSALPNSNIEQRRRPSHPHNLYRRPSEEMADRSQTQHRPRLEHRASQTIIDLTDEPEEISEPPRLQARRRPPHLGRSDAVSLANAIDLTEDSPEQEVIFTHEIQRQLPLPLPQPASRLRPAAAVAPRAESPSLFLPAHNHRPALHRVFGHQHAYDFGLAMNPGGAARLGGAGPGMGAAMGIGLHQEILDHLHLQYDAHIQAMPNGLNYQNAAFANQKPEHVAPPPAKDGFTRSPEEKDVVICPACEEELIQNNEAEEPVVKKSGKAPTKKEREEHPFWVVKECGHVSIYMSELLLRD